MNKFCNILIGKIGHTVTGRTPSSKFPEQFGSKYMFITPSDNFDDKIIYQTNRYLSEVGFDKLSGKIIPPKSVLVTCIGSAMGKVAMNYSSAVTNQQINSIIVNSDSYSADYIYYILKNNYKLLRNAALGSTALPMLNKTEFDNLELIIHEKLSTQKKIAKVLSDLDAKIELNNKINQELEAMAKTLYDYWFVQFDFPDKNGKPYKSSGGKMVYNEELKREIPEGWESINFESLGEFKNGVNYDPSNPGEIACPIINVRNISASSYFLQNIDLDIIYLTEKEMKNYMVNDDSIIIARSGIPGATRLVSNLRENTIYCGFAIRYSLNNLIYKFPVFFYLKSIEEFIKDGSGGTILKNVNQTTLKSLKTAFPKDELILKTFENMINPMFSKINLIQKQNQKLAELRDWLLPMLMNGQVTVGEAYAAQEEVLGMVAEVNAIYE